MHDWHRSFGKIEGDPQYALYIQGREAREYCYRGLKLVQFNLFDRHGVSKAL